MRIIHWGRAKQFYRKYSAAESPLKQWRKTVRQANWTNFSQIREIFPTADRVNGKIVFNIKGNYYRLIAIAIFENDRLYIKQVLTHEEYDKNKWKK